jgi:hypothetical protein
VKKVTFRLALDFKKNNQKARLDRVREKLGIQGESTEDWYNEEKAEVKEAASDFIRYR